MRTIAPVLCLALAACILQNPKFQDTESGGGSGSTSLVVSTTDGSTTTGASATTTTTGESASASGTTTTGDVSVSATGSTSSTTGPATCAEPCPTCAACVDGECVPEDMGVACGDSLECGDFVAGLFMPDDATIQCLAFAPQQLTGRCDGAGACVPAEPSSCEGAGEVLAACNVRCIQPVEVDCLAGGAAAGIELSSLCVTEASTETCPALCEAQGQEWGASGETCDALGHCVELTPEGCGDYTCHNGVGCLTSCDGPADCTDLSECTDNKCVQN